MATKRKAISKRVRFEVFKRDGFKCQYCGAVPSQHVLHVDHIVAVANGGDNGMDNLITSCEACNLGKSAVPLTSIPEGMREKTQRIKEQEEQIKGYSAVMEAKRERQEWEMWRVADALDPGSPKTGMLKTRLQSIKTFLTRLDYYEVLEAAEKTARVKGRLTDYAFRYFCGICWTKIKGTGNGSR